jgi:hypothetical protein
MERRYLHAQTHVISHWHADYGGFAMYSPIDENAKNLSGHSATRFHDRLHVDSAQGLLRSAALGTKHINVSSSNTLAFDSTTPTGNGKSQ